MAKKIKEEMPKFIDALKELSNAKGLSDEDVLFALEEAITRAFVKSLGGGDDAIVRCSVDPETGAVTLGQVKKVVEEVEDDYLEIELDEANENLKSKQKKYKVGDEYYIPCPTEKISGLMAQAIKNNLRQKLAEAERAALYRVYKDHIGEMVTGVVEKTDERSVTLTIGRATIEMGKKDLIGDEYFKVGDTVKVYIQEVKQPQSAEGNAPRGPQIEATRSSEGFLRCLFEEEIHEIYDGTVVIKAMARQAGVRSKVAVYSNNEDVDATGACIGQGGNRIQKVVSQLGNGKNKEKIDVLNYSPNEGAFLIEACRPVVALGANLDKENHSATVIINNGDFPIALGKFRANLTLAQRITGYKIEFVELDQAVERGLNWTTAEEWKEKAEEEKREAEKEAYLNKLRLEEAKRKEEEEAKAKAEEEARLAEEAKKEAEAAKPEEKPEEKVAPKAAARPEEFPAEAMNPAAAALAAFRASEAKAAAEAARKEAEPEKVEEKKEAVKVEEKTSEVRTTTTLEDLEKELEAAKEKKTRSASKKRPRKITEEEVKREATPVAPTKSPAINAMPVYTEEELAEMEEEEKEVYDDLSEEDIDEEYSEYDEYYDDDNA